MEHLEKVVVVAAAAAVLGEDYCRRPVDNPHFLAGYQTLGILLESRGTGRCS